MDNKRTKVFITTTGIYKVSPFKCEYRKAENSDSEMFRISFSVDLGIAFSCYVDKTIFYKSREQFREEINFLLELIDPELIKKEYKAANFKGYADQLANDINEVLESRRASGTWIKLYGKIRKRNGDKYAHFEDYLTKDGQYKIPYLARIDDTKGLYFTAWDLDNCVVPFKEVQTKENGNDKGAVENDTVESWSDNGKNFDDLPF